MDQISFDLDQKPEGLLYKAEFLSLSEEQELIERIRPLDWQLVKMHGVIAKRRVIHYGINYLYNSWKIEQTEPAPDFLKPLIARAAKVMKVSDDTIAEVLISHYPEGAGIGWHRDAPMFGDVIFGVSLLNPCTMRFRKKKDDGFETYSARLERRSAYLISGPARREWQHHIPGVKAERFSITLRTLK